MTSPEPTPALAIRPAAAADYDLFSRLFPELAVDDPIPDRERWQKEIEPGTLVIEDEPGRGAGYAFVHVLAGVGYVRHIVVDPSRRRAGIGRALLLGVARRLREAGCGRWCLNVKPENEAAIALYQGLGMAIQHRATALRFDWSLVDTLPRAPGTIVRPVGPEDDEALEVAFGLSPGQLALGRKQAGRVLFALADQARGDALGVAIFDPAFPGASPFRVARPELAVELLAALRPHALPPLPYMQLIAENDAGLARLLVERGAKVRFEMLHLSGIVPS
jgi:ribosomal protein S18 acetylase RimI-like enzyme